MLKAQQSAERFADRMSSCCSVGALPPLLGVHLTHMLSICLLRLHAHLPPNLALGCFIQQICAPHPTLTLKHRPITICECLNFCSAARRGYGTLVCPRVRGTMSGWKPVHIDSLMSILLDRVVQNFAEQGKVPSTKGISYVKDIAVFLFHTRHSSTFWSSGDPLTGTRAQKT